MALSLPGRARWGRISGYGAGFTLLEVVLVLVLLGIIGTVGTNGFLQFAQGFIMARENQNTAAKGQLAMMRLIKEFQSIKSASSATATRLTYTAARAGGDQTHTVQLSGSNLLLDNQVLLDHVTAFNLGYLTTYTAAPTAWSANTKLIDISLTISGAQGVASTLASRVALRNT